MDFNKNQAENFDGHYLICEGCGQRLNYSDVYCPHCGRRNYVTKNNTTTVLNETESKQTGLIKKIIIPVIIILLISCIVLFAGKSIKENKAGVSESNSTFVSEVKSVTKKKIEKVSQVKKLDEEENLNNEFNYEIPTNVKKPYSYCYYKPVIVEANRDIMMKSGPNNEYDDTIKLRNNSLVYIIGTSKQLNWSLIYYRYKKTFGWIESKYLTDVIEVTKVETDSCIKIIDGIEYQLGGCCPIDYKVSSDVGLVLRNAPNSNSRWILRMEYGDKVIDLGPTGNPDWTYVLYDDGIRQYFGFANNNYFKYVEPEYEYESECEYTCINLEETKQDCTTKTTYTETSCNDTETINTSDSDIESAYIDLIKSLHDDFDNMEFSDDGGRYLIYDMDNDGTTELIYINNDCMANLRIFYYTYDDGDVIKLDETYDRYLYETEDGIGLYSYFCHTGYEVFGLTTKNGNTIEYNKIFSGEMYTCRGDKSLPDDSFEPDFFSYNDYNGIYNYATYNVNN